jgi:hypothetical protein
MELSSGVFNGNCLKVSINETQSVQRQIMNWTTRVRSLGGALYFSLLHGVQTRSGAHPGSYNGYSGLFPGAKRPEDKADYSSPFSDEVKNGRAIPPHPRMTYVADNSSHTVNVMNHLRPLKH